MKRLATPYTRGKSDVIENFAPNGGTAVAEGVAVALQNDGTVKAVAVASDIVLGVAGVLEPSKKQSVVRSGLDVYVKLDAAANPTVGAAVYVTPAGLFTQTEDSNIAVNAVFKSGKVKAIDSKNVQVDAAAIDFPNGL